MGGGVVKISYACSSFIQNMFMLFHYYAHCVDECINISLMTKPGIMIYAVFQLLLILLIY
jgi:hypothetical protein